MRYFKRGKKPAWNWTGLCALLDNEKGYYYYPDWPDQSTGSGLHTFGENLERMLSEGLWEEAFTEDDRMDEGL